MPFRSFLCVALQKVVFYILCTVHFRMNKKSWYIFWSVLVCFVVFCGFVWPCSALFRIVPLCSTLFRFVPLCSALFCFVWPCSTFFRLVPLCSFLFRFVLLCSALVFFTLLNLVGSNAALCNLMSPFTKYISFLIQLKD